MTNSLRGEVALCLGGKTYTLKPTFGVVCKIEDAVQTNLFQIGQRLEQVNISARELVVFAQACLVHSGHDISLERLGEMILAEGVPTTIEALLAFCRSYAFGGRQEKKADPTQAQEPSRTTTATHGNS